MRSPRPRKLTSLSDSINRQLNMYALAASAAGVGVLALAQPAEAKIIYTPTHKSLNFRCPSCFLPIDLTNNGTSDFALIGRQSGQPPGGFSAWLDAERERSNEIRSSHGCIAALKRGQHVGPNGGFKSFGTMFFATLGFFSYTYTACPWRENTTAYLGLKFLLGGKWHYGWARVHSETPGRGNLSAKAILTGYAYETIPNKPIIAGKTKGWDVVTLPPGSLGTLALGRK